MTDLNITLRTDSGRVAAFCQKENYYTAGTIQDYSRLLDYVDNRDEINELSLNWIAWDIKEHSAIPWETLENIKHKFLNDACYIIRDE